MIKKICIRIFIAFIICVSIFYFTGQISATGSGVHTHQHNENAQHGHTINDHKVIVSLETQPLNIKAGDSANLLFHVKDNKGKPVKDLVIMHDRILHVVIISEDLSVFSHIHPEDFGTVGPDMVESARFPVRYVFPKAGKYLIAVDSAVKERHFSEQFLVSVTGGSVMGHFKKDLAREKKFTYYSVNLSSAEEHIFAGKETTLKYMISMNSEPVTDLEPYLSAPMHIALVSTDLKNFIHAHGEVPGSSSVHEHPGHMHVSAPDKFGPVIEARVIFPVKGTYQIFAEVKHREKVVVTSFMVEVE